MGKPTDTKKQTNKTPLVSRGRLFNKEGFSPRREALHRKQSEELTQGERLLDTPEISSHSGRTVPLELKLKRPDWLLTHLTKRAGE